MTSELDIVGLVLVFVPKAELDAVGEEAFFSRIDPYYPDYEEWEYGASDDPLPHSGIGRVNVIIEGYFQGVISGAVSTGRWPALPPDAQVLEQLPDGATCFAIITAEGFWIESYHAESSVLLYHRRGAFAPVNPRRPLTRMQAKWRIFVREHAEQHPEQVAIVGAAFFKRLSHFRSSHLETRSLDGG